MALIMSHTHTEKLLYISVFSAFDIVIQFDAFNSVVIKHVYQVKN